MARYGKSSARYRSRGYRGRGSSYKSLNRLNSRHSYRRRYSGKSSSYGGKRRGHELGLLYKPSRTVSYPVRRSRNNPIRKKSRTSTPKIIKPWAEPKIPKLPRTHIEPDTERIIRQLEERLDRTLQEEVVEKLAAELEKFTKGKAIEKVEDSDNEQKEAEALENESEQPQAENNPPELDEPFTDNIPEVNSIDPMEPFEENYTPQSEYSIKETLDLGHEQTGDLEQLLEEIEPLDGDASQEAEIFPEIRPELTDEEEAEEAMEVRAY